MTVKTKSGFLIVSVVVMAVVTALALGVVKVVTGSATIVGDKPAAKPKVVAPALPKGVSTEGNKTFYTIQPFDMEKRQGTLTFVAQRFNTTVSKLVSLNPQIKNPDILSIGQRIRVK